MTRSRIFQALLGTVLILAIIIGISNKERLNIEVLQTFLNQAGRWAPLIFILIYAVSTVIFLPGSLLTIAGGLLFGVVKGTLYNLIGATIGASFAFLIARFLASGWIEKRTGNRLRTLIRGVESEGWRFVAFVRLVPLFPFNLLNYTLGLTRIKLLHYILATFVCMVPGALAYTYIGYVGREALEGKGGMFQKGLWALGLLAIVIFLPRFVKRFKKRGPVR